jgi:peptide/nickel transport system permease protein
VSVSFTDQGDTAADATSPVAPRAGSAHLAARGRMVVRRFLRNRLAIVGLACVVLLYAVAFLGPLITPWGYAEQDYTAYLQPPSARHWFGTTQIGEDVFAQTVRGLQKSLTIGLLVGLISTSIAAVVGATAGYFGGWVDRGLMWVVDLLLVLPALLIIAIVSPAFRGKTWLILVVLLAVFSWMITARMVRGMTLSLRERDFVLAARFMGVPPWRIIVRHILPNIASLLIIDATITVGAAILGETGLSYLGFGVQPPDVSLGTLIAAGTGSALTFPWLFMFSGSLLSLTVLSVTVVGDGLRDAFDPASQRGQRRQRAVSDAGTGAGA